MSGYYFECPACLRVHDVNAHARPLVWFDVDRLDPASIESLVNQVNGIGPYLPIPTIGGAGAIGTVFPPTLPDRRCRECGEDGCVDCLPGEMCKDCTPEVDDDEYPEGHDSLSCLACLNGWGH